MMNPMMVNLEEVKVNLYAAIRVAVRIIITNRVDVAPEELDSLFELENAFYYGYADFEAIVGREDKKGIWLKARENRLVLENMENPYVSPYYIASLPEHERKEKRIEWEKQHQKEEVMAIMKELEVLVAMIIAAG
ncbi:MAG: hypothetical protein IKK43_03395 [Clostridia bacterium]|nr:hypothetical protein [Clostridia bacterium]